MAGLRLTSRFRLNIIKCSFIVFLFLDVPVILGGRLSGYFHNRGHGYPVRGGGDYLDLCDTPEGMSGECHPLNNCWAAEYDNYELERCEMQSGYQEQYCCPDRTVESIRVVTSERYPRPSHPPLRPTEKPIKVNPMQGFIDNVVKPVVDWLNPSGSKDRVTAAPQREDDRHVSSTFRPVKVTDRPLQPRPTRVPEPARSTRTTRMQVITTPVPRITNRPGQPWPTRESEPARSTRTTRMQVTTTPVPRVTNRPGQPWPTRESEPARSTRSTRRQTFTPTTTPIRRSTTRRNVVQPVFQTSCGQRGSDPEGPLDEREIASFVIGGTDAEERSWPWMVSIHSSRNGARSRFICGGSLITTRHVLTAAHCFEDRNQGTRYLVNFGSTNLTLNDQSSSFNHGQLPVIHIKSHEQYVPKVHYYDIAVLTLSENVIFSEDVSPICLPSTQELKMVTARAKVTLTGWGHTSYGGFQSHRLQEVPLQIIPLNRCQNSYDNFTTEALYEGVTTNMLCAGAPEGGMDACQGDSGGPLVMKTGRRWIQIGIVSFGYRCGVKDFPGVYTRISSFLRWINNVLT